MMNPHQSNLTNGDILFYKEGEPYYEFSNFFMSDIVYNDETWKSSEHLYQAQKISHNPDVYQLLRNVDTCGKLYCIANCKKSQFSFKWLVNKFIYNSLTVNDAIDIIKNNNIVIRSDWDNVKCDIMRYVVYLKFSTNERLRTLLLSTGNRRIIENSPRDDFWGIGKNGNGMNMLGIILMETREKLKN